MIRNKYEHMNRHSYKEELWNITITKNTTMSIMNIAAVDMNITMKNIMNMNIKEVKNRKYIL
jgi:hypothetical protein